MSVTAVVSAANHRRIRRAHSWLEGRAPAEEVLLVGATLDAANELARKVALEKGAAFGWHRLTMPQLAAAVAAPLLATRGLVLLSRLGTDAIVARVAHRLRAEGGLGRYRAVADTPGFPRAIAGVIAELRLARLPPGAFDSLAPDLVRLISAYEAELAQARLTDWPGLLGLATEAASGPNRHRLIDLPMLLLDVPITSEAELAFVGALAATAPEMLATIAAADLATLGRIRDRLGLAVEDLDQGTAAENPVGANGTSSLVRLQPHPWQEKLSQGSPAAIAAPTVG
jgi:ATP-dependent helicase/nuclease subunit B